MSISLMEKTEECNGLMAKLKSEQQQQDKSAKKLEANETRRATTMTTEGRNSFQGNTATWPSKYLSPAVLSNTRLQVELENLNSQLQAREIEALHLKQELESNANEMAELQDRCDQLFSLEEKLRQVAKEAEVASTKLKEQQSENSFLRVMIEEESEKRELLQKQLEEKDGLLHAASDSQRTQKDLYSTNQSVAISRRLEELQEENELLKEKLEDQRKASSEMEERLELENANLQEQLEVVSNSNPQQSTETHSNSELQGPTSQSSDLMSNLNQTKEVIQRIEQETSATIREKEVLERNIFDLGVEVQSKQEEIRGLKGHLEMATNNMRNFEGHFLAANNRIQELEVQVAQKEALLRASQQDLEYHKEQQTKLDFMPHPQRVKQEQEAGASRAILEEELSKSTIRVVQMEEQMQSLKRQLKESQDQEGTRERENALLKSEILESKKALEELRLEVNAYNQNTASEISKRFVKEQDACLQESQRTNTEKETRRNLEKKSQQERGE